ncbi:MAG TPA: DoxX family membrane protein [Acidobacteriaceae bacterium]
MNSDLQGDTNRALAVGLLRVALGVNMLGHGGTRILHGVAGFAGQTAEHLSGTILPHAVTWGFALAIPFIEAVLGVLLILGLWRRVVLVAGSAFVMMLTVGVTLNQEWAIAGQQLLYSAVFAALLFGLQWDRFALDEGIRG